MKRNLAVAVVLSAAAVVSAQVAADPNSGGAGTPSRKPVAASQPASQSASAVAGQSSIFLVPGELTAQQEKEVLEYLKDKRADSYKQLLDHQKKNPQNYQVLLRSHWYSFEQRKRLPPAVRDAQDVLQSISYTKMWQLAREIPKTKDAHARQEMERQLHELTARRFEAEQVIREQRIQQIMEQAKLLEEELKRRAASQDQVIREQVEQLLQNAARMAETIPAKPPTSQAAPASRPAAGASGASPAPHILNVADVR